MPAEISEQDAQAARDAAQRERERVEAERGGRLPGAGDRAPWQV